jgi:DNA-binding MltR family transcriptional regulator
VGLRPVDRLNAPKGVFSFLPADHEIILAAQNVNYRLHRFYANAARTTNYDERSFYKERGPMLRIGSKSSALI